MFALFEWGDSAVSGSTPLPYHRKNHSLENPERAVSAILGTTREVCFLLAGTTPRTVGTSRAYLLKTAFLPPLRESTPLLRESTPLTRGRLGRCRGRLQTCQFFLFVPETSLKLSGDVSAVPELFLSSQRFFNKSLKNHGNLPRYFLTIFLIKYMKSSIKLLR